MSTKGEDRDKIPENSNNDNTDFYQTASEGSTVVLTATRFRADQENLSYSWRYIPSEDYEVDITNPNSPSTTFKAPYIIDGDNEEIKTSITLTFQLTISGTKGESSNNNIQYVKVRVKRVQRAIIFQAGVALGAYEAGVFQALVKNVSEEHRKNGLENKRPLFDIVAGSSIGAMNAAVVINNAIKRKSWESSAEELVNFWRYQKYPWPTVADILNMNPVYHWWWEITHSTNQELKSSATAIMDSISKVNPYLKNWYDLLMESFSLEPNFWKDYFIDSWYVPATAEAARRYYSAYQSKHLGAPHVASGIPTWFAFAKFFDFTDPSNLWPRNFRADNKHMLEYSLKKTLQKFADFPIETHKPDPRLLLVTVDVQTGDAVIFDSYEKRVQTHDLRTKYYSEYGDEQNKHVISYNRGIETEHVLASGTFPDFFDYLKLNVKDPATSASKRNERHNFWDGSLRTTTPLREVIQAHRDYWHNPNTDEDDVPDLEVYIADLWPSELKEEPYSFDLDFVENRKWNILFSDKTDYDEQVAKVITDYSDLVNEIRQLAKRKGVTDSEIDDILKKHANSEKRNGERRTYKDVLGGRFRLTKVVRIDRKDDGNEVNDKIFDYSDKTIENLMINGYRDTLGKIGIQGIEDAFEGIKNKEGGRVLEDGIGQLKRQFKQIKRSIETRNGLPNSEIINQVEVFSNEVQSTQSIKEEREKTLLFNAVNQLKEILIETSNLNQLP